MLQLKPATSFSDPLVASLFVRKLYDSLEAPGHPLPPYHCVSYCWGTQHDMKYMTCDNRRMQITGSVDIMLRYLRKALVPQNVWVDAICINQNDNAEKAKHVRAMGTIYQQAEKVHVWLGPASADDQIGSVFAALKRWALSSFDRYPVFDVEGSHSWMLAPLRNFFARPWFTRRWIIQEVMLARNAIVHCGPHRLSWSWIRDGVASFQSDYARNYRFGPCSDIVSIETARALKGVGSLGSRARSRLTILQLLWDHHSSKCEDERDRIFALYGMIPSDSDDNIEPSSHCPVDYNKHYSAIYTQLTIAAIKQGDALTILNHAIVFGSLADQDMHWPSWVPSWNKMRRSQGLPLFKGSGPNQGLHSMKSASVDWADDTTRLALEGTIYPITQVHIANEANNVRQFFDVSHWPSWKERFHPIKLLLRGIQDAGYLNDRVGFDFETMFPSQSQSGSAARDWSNTFARLELYLKQEFGYGNAQTQNTDVQCEPGAILQETRRLMKDHTLVVYGQDNRTAPGIASRAARAGDYIFRPNGLARSSEYALLLRCTKSGEQDKLGRRTFRLIGYCLHSPNSQVFSEAEGSQRFGSCHCTILLE